VTVLLVVFVVVPVLAVVIASLPTYLKCFRLASVRVQNVQNHWAVTEPQATPPPTVKLYTQSVADALHTIKMAGAEACPALFNDVGFETELRKAIMERGCSVSIIVGPYLLAGRRGNNKLVDLLAELQGGPYAPHLQVYLSPIRLEHHFTIIDDTFYLLESPHRPSASPRFLTRVEGYQEGLKERIIEFGRLSRACTPVLDPALLEERLASPADIERRYLFNIPEGGARAA